MNKPKSLIRYSFLAKATPGLEQTLIKELKSYSINAKSLKKTGVHEIKFQVSQRQAWWLLFHSHTIDRLKIQIGDDFVARSDREFVKGLHQIDWKPFLPLSSFENYKLPRAKCHSYSSKLYHEGKVEGLLEKFINMLPAKMASKRELHEKKHPAQAKIIKSQSKTPEVPQEEKELKTLSTFYAYLYGNKAIIAMDVISESLHKHGFKNAIGWGSLRESIASCCLIESLIIAKAKHTKSLRIWDPFCGAGTILLESFLMFLDVPIRYGLEESFQFKDWPLFDKKAYNSFKETIEEKLENRTIPEGYNIEIYGSDISPKELNKSVINFKNAKINEFTYQTPEKTLELKQNNPLIRTNKIGDVAYLINADFEVAAGLLDLNQLNVIANIPYGRRSSKYFDEKELQATYIRFGKFLRSNKWKLGDIFVICPEEADRVYGGFITLSDMPWERVAEFNNQGIKVALFKLEKKSKKALKNKSSEKSENKDLESSKDISEEEEEEENDEQETQEDSSK